MCGVWDLETERAFSGSVPVLRDETILKNILLSFSGADEISRPLLTSYRSGFYNSGGEHFLAKPVSVETLDQAIEAVMPDGHKLEEH